MLVDHLRVSTNGRTNVNWIARRCHTQAPHRWMGTPVNASRTTSGTASRKGAMWTALPSTTQSKLSLGRHAPASTALRGALHGISVPSTAPPSSVQRMWTRLRQQGASVYRCSRGMQVYRLASWNAPAFPDLIIKLPSTMRATVLADGSGIAQPIHVSDWIIR